MIALRTARRGLALVFAVCAWLALSGCAHHLPPLPERTPSTHLIGDAAAPLARAYTPPAGDASLNGVALLRDPMQALATRVVLARAAQRALDVQVYIWRPDASGLLMLHELRRAAQRGVRVRVLLDDNGSDGMDPWLQAAATQAGVEVRLFNPFAQRRFKALGYLSDFQRLNHRMHNKSFTADSLATIVGGRNIGDVYYGVDADLLFADLDLIALGPAAQATARHFDGFWNSRWAYPLTGLLPPIDPEELARMARQLDDPESLPDVAQLLAELQRSPWVSAPLGADPPLQWAPVAVLSDTPAKLDPQASPEARMLEPLARWLRSASRSLDLVSPYFVPGEAGVKSLVELARRGVAVRIITNSLAATDVMAVHAGYARHRRALLAAGIELHELKPDAIAQVRLPRLPWNVRLGASSAASLHGKTFLVDGQRLFVGSFNLDPRSARLNTEMGLTVDSPVLTRALADAIARDMTAATWRVSLSPDGNLQWAEIRADGTQQVHAREPGASLLRRLGARVLSWLPIDGLL